MHPSRSDRQAAFLLSLAVPGAGQLFAGHWTCVVWFLAALGLGAASLLPVPLDTPWAAAGQVLTLALLGLLSAEHAKRCLEPRGGDDVAARVDCATGHASAVRLSIELDVSRPHAVVWRHVADFPKFVCVDPFHSRIVIEAPTLRPGVHLALEHQAFGLRFWRRGRLLTWHEGHGYAFSDLSAAGPGRGFPHVFFVSVSPITATRTRLRVDIRGKWTARWLPLWAGNCWLRYVCCEHARLLRTLFSEDDP